MASTGLPEFEVHSENDRAAFDRFLLRSDQTVARIIARSRHRFVLFKPLCDSHRVDQLLDGVPSRTPGRAIWVYRDVDGRARSALSKFGRNNLLVLADIAAGRGAGMWQAQRAAGGLDGGDLQLRLPDHDPRDRRRPLLVGAQLALLRARVWTAGADVMLASYEDLLTDPRAGMQAICSFLGFAYRPELVAHIAPRTATRARLDLDPRVRQLCEQLQERLDTTLRAQRQGRAA